ncbi:MAG: hypothetical protein ACWGPR_08525 [Candidatus Deferrimicrobiaceae bacterium]
MANTVNDRDLIAAEIHERTIGNWYATLEVDSEEELDTAVTIDIDGVTWVGTVWRGAIDSGRYRCTVVGGAGGLETVCEPAWYDHGVALRTPLEDALALGGETLSSESDSGSTARVIPRWHRARGKLGEVLAAIRDKAPSGAQWRTLRDGTVWIGVDTFPELAQDEDDVITDPMPDDGIRVVAPETPYIYPGVTYDGECVTEVWTTLKDRKLRQRLICRPADTDTLTREQQITARIRREILYLRQFPAKVLSQSGGTVDVLPEDPRIAGRGLTGVPMRHGLPGVTVSLAIGSRVLLGFEGGDPSAPFVALWPDGSSVDGVTFAGDLTVTGDLSVGGDVDASEFTAGGVAYTTHVHAETGGITDGPQGP